MPRRVVSRLLQLDSLDVIRAKEKRFRELALSRSYDSALTSVQGPESSTAAERARQEEPGTRLRDVNNEQKSALTTESADDSSRLVDIAYEAGATEHAIPNAPQPVLTEISTLSSGDALIKDKAANATIGDGASLNNVIPGPETEDSAAIEIQNIQQASTSKGAKSMGMSNEFSKSRTTRGGKKLLEPSKHESTAISRPKRSARKSYVLLMEPDVDWDEDLRPTDEESDKAGGHGGTAVTSPDPEYRNSSDRKSPKRKKRQSGPDSSKRRKALKGKTNPIPEERDQSLQLPLTTGPTVIPQTEITYPGFNSRPINGQFAAATTKGTADTTATPFPLTSDHEKQIRSQVNVEKHEVIEISSSSPPSSDQAGSEYDPDQHSSHVSPTSNANAHAQGRGEVVGTKLSDALREAGLSLRRTNKLARHSSRALEAATDSKKANTSATSQPWAQESPVRNSLTSESSMDQGQVESKSGWSTLDSRMLPAQVRSSSPASYLLPESMSIQGLFDHQIHTVIDGDRNEVIYNPMAATMNSTKKLDEELANSQEFAQSLGSKANTSSQTSSAAKTDHRATLLTHGNQSQNTPESEKPLLTKETPLESIPLSAPRSIIVDHNGSPRLTTQGKTNDIQAQPLLEYDRMGNIDMIDTSSSDYDPSSPSEMYSPGYTPDSQRTWSKFHRDIVAEYGIDTEQLIREGDRPISLKKASESDTATCGTKHADRQYTEKLLETRLTTPPRRDDTPAEARPHIDHEKASAMTATSSPGPTDEAGLCGRHRSGDRRENPFLSRISDPSYPGVEPPRSLMQNDANGMEWISALQTAQRSAHDLLLETNQVSSIN
jgi:hypothetical protein